MPGLRGNTGAYSIGTGFWGILYSDSIGRKRDNMGNYLGFYSRLSVCFRLGMIEGEGFGLLMHENSPDLQRRGPNAQHAKLESLS